jgi:hypothetical protein
MRSKGNKKHISRQTSIEISINTRRMSFDGGSDNGSWVNGVRKTTREEEERHTVRREIQDAAESGHWEESHGRRDANHDPEQDQNEASP